MNPTEPTPEEVKALKAAELQYRRMHESLMQNSKNQLAHWLLRLGAELDRERAERAAEKKSHDPQPV